MSTRRAFHSPSAPSPSGSKRIGVDEHDPSAQGSVATLTRGSLRRRDDFDRCGPIGSSLRVIVEAHLVDLRVPSCAEPTPCALDCGPRGWNWPGCVLDSAPAWEPGRAGGRNCGRRWNRGHRQMGACVGEQWPGVGAAISDLAAGVGAEAVKRLCVRKNEFAAWGSGLAQQAAGEAGPNGLMARAPSGVQAQPSQSPTLENPNAIPHTAESWGADCGGG